MLDKSMQGTLSYVRVTSRASSLKIIKHSIKFLWCHTSTL